VDVNTQHPELPYSTSMGALIETACLIQRIAPLCTGMGAGILAARTLKLVRNWLDLVQRTDRADSFQNRLAGARLPEVAAARFIGMELAAISNAVGPELSKEISADIIADIQAKLMLATQGIQTFTDVVAGIGKLDLSAQDKAMLGMIDSELMELAA
jgi:hypothetical protein